MNQIITAELSLYPLKEDYEEVIIAFIQTLKKEENLEVLTHSMSTFVKGQSNHVFMAISNAVNSLESFSTTISLVIKIINRDLPVQEGFLDF